MNATGRQRDAWVPRHRGEGGATARKVIAVHEVRHPRGAAGGCDERVESMGAQHEIEPLYPRQAATGRERLSVRRRSERPLGLGLEKYLLSEVRHGRRRVFVVEADQVGQRLVRCCGTQRGEVGGDVRFRLVQQDLELGGLKVPQRLHRHRVNQYGAGALHGGQRLFHYFIDRRSGIKQFAYHTDARPLEARCIAEAGVVTRHVSRAASGRDVARVRTRHDRQECRRVAHRAAHRPRRVLRAGDGDDARARNQANRRLYAHQSVGAGRTDDGSVRLRSNPNRRQVGRNRCPCARRGTAGIAVEGVGVARLSAPPAPSAAGARGSPVGPFGQVDFSQHNRAGRAQTPNDLGIGCCQRFCQRQRARRGVHPVGSVDVVLDEHGNAVHRSAHRSSLPLPIERLGNRQCVGVDLEHGVERRTRTVHRVNALEIHLRDRSCRPAPTRHTRLQLGHRDLVQFEGGNARSGDRQSRTRRRAFVRQGPSGGEGQRRRAHHEPVPHKCPALERGRGAGLVGRSGHRHLADLANGGSVAGRWPAEDERGMVTPREALG